MAQDFEVKSTKTTDDLRSDSANCRSTMLLLVFRTLPTPRLSQIEVDVFIASGPKITTIS